MRLLVITQDYPPPFVGGSVVYVHNLLAGLDASVALLTGPLPPGTVEPIEPRHRAIRSRFLTPSHDPSRLDLVLMYAYLPFWLLTRRAWRHYDAAILSTGAVGNALLILVLRTIGLPAIPIAYAEELTIPLRAAGTKNAIKRWLLRTAYHKASGFVSVCGFTRDVLVSLGVPADRIEIIVPMIGRSKQGHARPASRRAGHRVLTVGRLVTRKGFDLLAQAVSLLRRDIPDVHLTIVGNGPERARLEQLIASAGLQDNVTLAGQVTDEELRQLYERADVFALACIVLPNGDCEGTPTVFIEASALGIPVVAGTGGGTDAAVEDGRNGFRVDCRDVEALAAALRRLLTDPDLARRMGAAGIEKVAAEHVPAVAARRLQRFVERLTA